MPDVPLDARERAELCDLFVAKGNVAGLTPAYVENFYWPFFCSNDFQLWSMNNLDQRVRGSWRGASLPP